MKAVEIKNKRDTDRHNRFTNKCSALEDIETLCEEKVNNPEVELTLALKKETKHIKINQCRCNVDYIEQDMLDSLLQSHVQAQKQNKQHKEKEELD